MENRIQEVKKEKKNNVIKEAYGFGRNVVIGRKTKKPDGGVIIEKDSVKHYSLPKVIIGTGLVAVGATAATIGAAIGIQKLTSSDEEDVVELPEEVTSEEVVVEE